MKPNKVTAMTVEEIQAAAAMLTRMHKGMEFLLPLNKAERMAAGRIGASALRVAQMRLMAVREHKDALPPMFDVRKFEREVALFTALGDCVAALESLRPDVRDTFLAIGRSALESGKIAYAHLQASAAASDSLKKSVHLAKFRPRKAKTETPKVAVGNQDAPAPALPPNTAVFPAINAAPAPTKVEINPEPSGKAA